MKKTGAEERTLELTKMQERAVGCLVGGAAGDALGYAVEFMQDAAIFRKYGERGITEYTLVNGVAEISDDTQMTMFTAEGLILSGGEEPLQAIYEAYLRWLDTQEREVPRADTGLASLRAMCSRRAPGMTCLGALGSGICGSVTKPINHSKGCGGVMRVAPIAVYCHARGIPCAKAARLAAEAAAITHGHPLGYIPAALLVYMLYRIFEGASLREALADAMASVPPLFGESEYTEVALRLLERAVELADDEVDELDAIRVLGEGWVAEETLAIAVYCCLKHPQSFEDTLVAAVNHSGDSDSTGSVAGNIIGALLGSKRIGQKFLSHLEMKETVEALALALCRDRGV